MSSKKKTNQTAIRVLEVLKILLNSSISYAEIFNLLDEKDNIETVYSKGTIQKYFNTFNLLGYEINKQDGKYFAINKTSKINFSENEVHLLLFIENFVNFSGNKDYKNSFNIITKIIKREVVQIVRNKQIKVNLIKEEYFEIINKLEKYINDGLKLKIDYEGEILTIVPIKILHTINDSYLYGYNQLINQNQKLKLSNINSIIQTPQKRLNVYSAQSIVFKLKGRLAKTYILKENEKIISNYSQDEQMIIISNNSEDIDFLMHRLIRYGENCEILQPQAIREYFIDFISKIEEIYN